MRPGPLHYGGQRLTASSAPHPPSPLSTALLWAFCDDDAMLALVASLHAGHLFKGKSRPALRRQLQNYGFECAGTRRRGMGGLLSIASFMWVWD